MSTRRGSLTFDDVREIALSLPDVEETTAYGMPAFKAGKTRFAGKPVGRSDVEPNTLGVSVNFEERDALIAARPDVYYLTPHFANYPAVLARLTNLRRAELRELLGAAWRHAMERQAPVKKKRPAAARRSKARR
jgi:hypothetical protein